MERVSVETSPLITTKSRDTATNTESADDTSSSRTHWFCKRFFTVFLCLLLILAICIMVINAKDGIKAVSYATGKALLTGVYTSSQDIDSSSKGWAYCSIEYFDCERQYNDNPRACTSGCEYNDNNGLWCCPTPDVDGGCFAYDSIVTRVLQVISDPLLSQSEEIITENVMIKDIQLEDYVLSGINNEFSKVIHRTHFTKYDGFDKLATMRRICVDMSGMSGMNGNNNSVNSVNCIELTDSHLIYVNGIELDSLKQAKEVTIGDYLYNEMVGMFVNVVSVEISKNKKYFRDIVTANGNIVINNGFIASTVTGNDKYSHLGYVSVTKVGYYVFNSIFGIILGSDNAGKVMKSEYFERFVRIPVTNAVLQLTGGFKLLSNNYPLKDTLIVQFIYGVVVYCIYRIICWNNSNK